MVLGVEKRVRSEYGESVKDTSGGDRGIFTSIFLLLFLMVALAVGGIAYMDHRVESAQEAMSANMNTLLSQRDDLDGLLAGLNNRLSDLELNEKAVQSRLSKLEESPDLMGQVLLRSTLYDIDQKLVLLKSQRSYPPEVVQALGKMQESISELAKQVGSTTQ